MDSLNIDANNISGLVQTLGTSGASELGFMAGVLLVLVIIMLAFAVATFVLGIVATVKATKAGRTCGWEPAMAKASLGFGIFAIVSPFIALKVPDGMGATLILVAGFIMAIVAIASASNRLKIKVIADRAPVAASREDNPVPEAPALANPEAAEHAAQVAEVEPQLEPADESVDSLVYDGEDASQAEMAVQVTEPLAVISCNEALVNPVDPIEPVIEDETPSSVDDMQVDEQTEKADGEGFGDDDAIEDVADDVSEDSEDDSEEEEEPVEPMHKMTSDERDAEIAAIKADAAQRAAERAAAKARALERAAEDPEYAAYLLEQGKLKGSLKKND